MKVRKVISIIVAVVFVLGVVFVFTALTARNFFIKRIIETTIEAEMNLPITIKDLDASLFGNRISVKGVTIENPKMFKNREMAYISKMDIVYDAHKFIFKNKHHFYYLHVALERVNVITLPTGITNFSSLEIIGEEDSVNDEPLRIDVFDMDLQDIYLITHKKSGEKPTIQRYNMNIDGIAFKNVDSFEDIINLIVLQIISNKKIAKVLDLTVTPLSKNLKNITMLSGKTATDAVTGVAKLPFMFFKKK